MENIMANYRKKDYLLLLLYRIKYRSPTVRYLIGKSLRCRGIHVSNGETHSIPLNKRILATTFLNGAYLEEIHFFFCGAKLYEVFYLINI